jgi:pimeloyl-ACP methyl ester carboxylesterase
VKLGGTLTLPRDRRPSPAVILISGSGPQDRDETAFQHKPFLVLADHLTRSGIAVLRFDDRGVGKSTGDIMQSTAEDFVGDVLAGVAYLETRKEIDPRKIGLVGHSEGGTVAAMAAARSGDVAFLVMLAGSGLPGEELLYLQAAAMIRAAGGDDAALERERRIQTVVFDAIRNESEPAVAAKRAKEALQEELKKLPDAERERLGEGAESFVDAQVKVASSPWFRSFLTLDPGVALSRVKCPVLALIGEKDLQVPPKENLRAIEQALRANTNTDATVKELPGLNHLFQTSKTGAVAEYVKIEETFSPKALELISSWIREHAR